MKKNKVVVGHWGPSEIYSPISPLIYSPTKALPNLPYYSISIRGAQHVEFNNLRNTLKSHKSALQKIKSPDNSNTTTQKIDPQNNQDPIGGIKSGFEIAKDMGKKVINSVSNLLNFSSDQAPVKKPKKLCTNDKSCNLCYSVSDKNPTKTTHLDEFMHSCLYGTQCINYSEQHKTRFLHKPLTICPNDTTCALKINPQHREQFAHTNLWDFMLQCRKGTACNNNCDPLKYYH